MAGARLLAGQPARRARHADRHGPVHGGHSQPPSWPRWVSGFGSLHRRPRLRGQPGRGDRAGSDRRGLLSGQPRLLRPSVVILLVAVLPRGLGPDRGLRLLRRPRHRPQQHDPDRAAGGRRLPGADPRRQRPATVATPVAAAGTAAAGAPPDAAAAERPRPGWRDLRRPALARAFGVGQHPGRRCGLGGRGRSSSAPAPMALAQANPNADPIIAQAIDGNARR